jgi:hypothetical protein
VLPAAEGCSDGLCLVSYCHRYAILLAKHLIENPAINVWLVNTGWAHGGYLHGQRMPLHITRSIVSAIQAGAFEQVRSRPPRARTFVPCTVRLLMCRHGPLLMTESLCQMGSL